MKCDIIVGPFLHIHFVSPFHLLIIMFKKLSTTVHFHCTSVWGEETSKSGGISSIYFFFIFFNIFGNATYLRSDIATIPETVLGYETQLTEGH